MVYGNENATQISWRNPPDLLINEESLVDIITQLRTQLYAIQSNELICGNSLPTWLLNALTDVANNVDAVVECQSMQEQFTSLQQEVLELRHLMMSQQGASNVENERTFNPTPHHRFNTKHRESHSNININNEPIAGLDTSQDALSMREHAAPTTDNLDKVLKPIWKLIHKQSDDFSKLKDIYKDTRETVARLQAEIKRRDAVILARNNKHEAAIQTQIEKLSESMRACVTRNDLIGSEQRINIQFKTDRVKMLEDLEKRSNKILEDLINMRSDQEDINSTQAETMQMLSSHQNTLEERLVAFNARIDHSELLFDELKEQVQVGAGRIESNSSLLITHTDKLEIADQTRRTVKSLIEDLKKMHEANDLMIKEIVDGVTEQINSNIHAVRGEISHLNCAVKGLIDQNLDEGLKVVVAKVDSLDQGANDVTHTLSSLQNQFNDLENSTELNFTTINELVESIVKDVGGLSSESLRMSNSLQQTVETNDSISHMLEEQQKFVVQSFEDINSKNSALTVELEKSSKLVAEEFGKVKNYLICLDGVNTKFQKDIEDIHTDMEKNLQDQKLENVSMHDSLSTLHNCLLEQNLRQDSLETKQTTMQAETLVQIQTSTTRLTAIVDKESDRVEALYASFQEKQDKFADVVARSSIRNMEIEDIIRELDRLCECFVQECWKYETSARSSKLPPPNNNAPTTRKLFNERQQQLLVKNCQFTADLIVAEAEYKALQIASNKEVKNQVDVEESIFEIQGSLVDKFKQRMRTKISNNKNIGEQYDKGVQERREVYIATLSNLLDATITRRSLQKGLGRISSGWGNDALDGQSTPMLSQKDRFQLGYDDPAFRRDCRSGTVSPDLRIQTGVKGNSIPFRSKASGRINSAVAQNNEVVMPSPFSPKSAFVMRGGFRFPKEPASPIQSTQISVIAPTDERFGPSLQDSPSKIDVLYNTPSDSSMEGWVIDDNKDGDLNSPMLKSCSLPALKH